MALRVRLRRSRGQASLLMLAVAWAVLLGAVVLFAFGNSLGAKGRYQRAADLAAISAAQVNAQVMQRHRVDEALIWQLMRFPDEPEERHPGPANETRIETTGRIGATSRGGRDAPANKKTPS